MRSLQSHFEPLQDLSHALEDCEVLSLNPWYNGTCHILARTILAHDVPIDDPYLTRSNLRVRVLEVSEHGVGVFDLPGVQPYLDFVQPMPDRCFFVGSSRARYSRSRKEYDRNARVVTDRGEQVRSFSLGDAVEDVQATSDGKLWVSYFDEGISGPPRQGGGGRTTALTGLVLWSSTGEVLHEYEADMLDCYAINLENDSSLWACHFPNFPLVRITPDDVDSVFPATVCGAKAFAVSRRGVLFGPGYGIAGEDRASAYRLPTCSLYEFDANAMQLHAEFLSPFEQQSVVLYAARGPYVFWLDGDVLRRLNMDELYRLP